MSEFPPQKESLKKNPNQNLKKKQLETYVSTKDILSFQYNRNQDSALEIRASRIYSLFKKYAPALDLEIRKTSDASYKEKVYSKVMAYDNLHQVFFIENSFDIDLRLNINYKLVIDFKEQELLELLKIINWKFKKCRENKDSYFYNEWKFDETTSLLRPLKGDGFEKSIRLGKSTKKKN